MQFRLSAPGDCNKFFCVCVISKNKGHNSPNRLSRRRRGSNPGNLPGNRDHARCRADIHEDGSRQLARTRVGTDEASADGPRRDSQQVPRTDRRRRCRRAP